MAIKSVDEARHEREMLEFKIDELLRRAGWKSVTDTPGCYWMWEREIDGRRFVVDKEMALTLQRQIEFAAQVANATTEDE